ncbi:FAD-binding protein [Desulfolutivibrio sulfoxidireducens]|uniref:FAD-binding protein n=1 Tax=Desulfolutivibrio sulfoxidireducens TaxID=2773299 RepID=UPI00159D9CAD|nr:FAD-binding protein [Desulfolutivibrio sulfoxidireducens]QLA14812.1 FAD-dependent oxidoreductase [Desulfolutivibrio sulfoxidireducens]
MRPDPVMLPEVDVLVLGAGLAGLRAAWRACEAMPGAVVAVVAPDRGPQGSSFSNVNDRLGLFAPEDDARREEFCRQALALGPPGMVREKLVAVLAREALARRLELEALGLDFTREADGALRRFGACFSQASRQAVAFSGLTAAFDLIRRRVISLGGKFLPGMTALDLLQEGPGGRVLGALLEDGRGDPRVQPARAVVAAMGGPAPLFRYNQAGRGLTGYGHGILARAGARMANTAYLQWMWAGLPDLGFWPVWSLLGGNFFPVGPAGTPVEVPDAVRAAAASRSTHCPLGHGLADAALDRFLLDLADDMGRAVIQEGTGGPGTRRFQVVLAAHAGNGGAVVDEDARTGVPGLYAVGECATGMHGANRVGGAMVAACLVFGARAGRDAASGSGPSGPDKAGLAAAVARSMQGFRRDPGEREAVRDRVALVLQRYGLPRAQRPAGPLESMLAGWLGAAADAGAMRLLETALCFARGGT